MRIAVAASQLKEVGQWTGATYEIRELRDASHEIGIEPLPVPLRRLQFNFPSGRPAETLLIGLPLERVDVLVVRRTGAYLDAAHLLTSLMAASGATTMDPIDRFSMGGASKLLSTASRHQRQVGSSTVVVFDPSGIGVSASNLRQRLDRGRLLGKPMSGAHGQGVVTIDDVEHLPELADRFDGPFLLQPFEQIEAEYRIMLLDAEPIGVALKQSIDGGPANAARGAAFRGVDDSELVNSLLAYVGSTQPPMGLVGMDVASTPSGFFVIEENYAPEWKALDAALGQRTARIILDRLLTKARL